jgi:RND family efflux transporter MFP subunit
LAVIQKFYVNEGDKVSQNSLIVKIDDTELRLSVEEAQAGFNIAFVTFEEALTEYTRMKSLYDEKAVTKQQFDKAESAYKLAQAKLNQAKARLKLVKQQLKNTYIYAPICGIVSKKFAEESEMIAIGSPILQIVNLNPVRIELEIPEDKIAEVKLSQISKVKVDAYPNEVFLGRVTYIAPVASAQSRTFLVKCDVQNPKNLLKAGMFARITLITKSLENVLLIPKEAIIDDSYVFVVGKDNRAHLRKIKIGISSDLKVQVKEGLCEGEMVVTEGNIGLKDNQLVVVEEKPLS